MKRSILIFAAAAAMGLPLGQQAMALDGRDDDRKGNPERQDPPRQYERRDDSRRPPVRSFRDDGGRRYDDGPSPLPDTRPARRGGYLPDAYRGGIVDDYQRYRLRAPPRGYAWVRLNGGFALVSLDDGRIFDMVQ